MSSSLFFQQHLFKEHTFRYSEVRDFAPDEKGIYFWYLAPSFHSFSTESEFKVFLKSISHVPSSIYSDSFDSISKLAKIENKSFDLNFSGNDDEEEGKLKLNRLISKEMNLGYLRSVLPYLFLTFPPLRIGIACPDTLYNRLSNYSDLHRIKKIINEINLPSYFDVNHCLIKCFTFDEKNLNLDNLDRDSLIYLFEKWHLRWNTPVANIKRGN